MYFIFSLECCEPRRVQWDPKLYLYLSIIFLIHFSICSYIKPTLHPPPLLLCTMCNIIIFTAQNSLNFGCLKVFNPLMSRQVLAVNIISLAGSCNTIITLNHHLSHISKPSSVCQSWDLSNPVTYALVKTSLYVNYHIVHTVVLYI